MKIHEIMPAPAHLFAVYTDEENDKRAERITALCRVTDTDGSDQLIAYVIGDSDELKPAATYDGFSHLAWLKKKPEA